MKYTAILTAAVILGASLYAGLQNNQTQVPAEIRVQFLQWKLANKKLYGSPSEDNYRLSVFYKNVLRINAHNNQGTKYTMAVNKFADLTSEEFKAKYTSGSIVPPAEQANLSSLSTEGLPSSIDWTTRGAVTPVKNQGQCGSCWSFSTTGSLEGLRAIEGHGLLSLSEQQLMDCSTSYGNHGCQGGLMPNAFKYVIANGIESEAEYPYEMRNDRCRSNPSKYVFHIRGFRIVRRYNNPQLKAAVARQPVSIAVDATALQFYQGGIINFGCGQQLDHGVLAVGYGNAQGENFWKVKNSWGAGWGEDGYFRVKRATRNRQVSQCGVSKFPSYPTGGRV